MSLVDDERLRRGKAAAIRRPVRERERRLRYETIEGQARAGFNSDDTLFNIRTQILAEYRGDDIRIGAELFDSRAYGADSGTPISTNEMNTFELVQAYVAGE